jgi:hypothetical protein
MKLKQTLILLLISVFLTSCFFANNDDGGGSSNSGDTDDSISATWNRIDGDTAEGLTRDLNEESTEPEMIAEDSNLLITWVDSSESTGQIRLAGWDGTDWYHIDGPNGLGSPLNKDASNDAFSPHLTMHDGKLYVAWSEYDGEYFDYHIHIAEWDSSGAVAASAPFDFISYAVLEAAGDWNFVDPGAGANIDLNESAYKPHLISFNNELYASWYEKGASWADLRVTKWDGATSWDLVDGGPLDYDATADDATNPHMVEFNGKLYIAFQEYTSSFQIRVKEYTPPTTWSFIDGGGATGLNYDTSKSAINPFLYSFDGSLYITWTETVSESPPLLATYATRVAKWDGSSSWSFIDGGGVYGVYKDNAMALEPTMPRLIEYNSSLYLTWSEPSQTSSNLKSVRIVKLDGVSSWSFVDGDGTDGIIVDDTYDANEQQLMVMNSKLYLAWEEDFYVDNGDGGWEFSKGHIHVAEGELE